MQVAPRLVQSEPVKMSKAGIRYAPSNSYYSLTKNFVAYEIVQGWLGAGGGRRETVRLKKEAPAIAEVVLLGNIPPKAFYFNVSIIIESITSCINLSLSFLFLNSFL